MPDSDPVPIPPAAPVPAKAASIPCARWRRFVQRPQSPDQRGCADPPAIWQCEGRRAVSASLPRCLEALLRSAVDGSQRAVDQQLLLGQRAAPICAKSGWLSAPKTRRQRVCRSCCVMGHPLKYRQSQSLPGFSGTPAHSGTAFPSRPRQPAPDSRPKFPPDFPQCHSSPPV